VLHVLYARLTDDRRDGLAIEDELVRSGARGARLFDDGEIAVTVAAASSPQARDLVQALLRGVGAEAVELREWERPRTVAAASP
jgi:hypothetical protein